MNLTLHHAPDFASTIVRMALEELELPHTLSIVDFDAGALQSAAIPQDQPGGPDPGAGNR